MELDIFVEKIISDYKSLENKILKSYEDLEISIKLTKEKAKIEKLFELCLNYKKNQENLISNNEMIKDRSIDQEFRDLLKDETKKSEIEIERLKLLIEEESRPKDPNDDKNVILEIRAGTGGEEASLFAEDLMNMYARFSDYKKWKFDIIESHLSETKGIKSATINVIGVDVYSVMKYESGTHRVQRVPATENSGRLHTSAATVVVLPELDDLDINIKKEDLEIDVFKSGGAGGQHVNKTESAVRIKHIPTGIIIVQQDGRSQIANREKGMKILRSRIFEFEEEKRNKEITSARKSQIGSGDRSEKIRTYNFPQNRITDHRINFSLHNLEEIMNQGKQLDIIISELKKKALSDNIIRR